MKISLRRSLSAGGSIAEAVMRNALANAGGVVAVATIISMITSTAFRGWVRRNPYPIFIALVLVVAIAMLLLDKLRDITRKYNDLNTSTTEHDRQLFAYFKKLLPAHSRPMQWLKQDFSAESLPWDPKHALEEAVRKLDLNPIGFDDQSIGAAYNGFRSAITDFQTKVQLYAKPNAQNTSFEIPYAWRFDDRPRYEAALTGIQSARDAVISSYDEFLLACHRMHADDEPSPLNPG